MAKKKISFYFKPSEANYAIQKEELVNGKKVQKMYLEGIASGEGLDAHNERMSAKCIEGFMNQANSKEILLYPYPHGIEQGNDYARLDSCEKNDNGDWVTKFCLYDGSEGAVQSQVDKARVVWNQANGIGQYKKKTVFGFSIEGIIPEADGIIKDGNTGLNILDKVDLDGVISTPRPAYQASIAEPVFKALGMESPQKVKRDLQGILRAQLDKEVAEDDLWKITWRLRDALDESIKKVMTSQVFVDDASKREQLSILFDEYQVLMIEEIMKSQKAFEDDDEGENTGVVMNDVYGKGKNTIAKSKEVLQKELANTITKLIQINK